MTSVTEIENRPTIRFPAGAREPIEPILSHAVWLLHRWRPAEADVFGCEAIYTIEQLASRLEAHNEEIEAYREVARAALEQLARLTAIVERLNARIRALMFGKRREDAA